VYTSEEEVEDDGESDSEVKDVSHHLNLWMYLEYKNK